MCIVGEEVFMAALLFCRCGQDMWERKGQVRWGNVNSTRRGLVSEDTKVDQKDRGRGHEA